MRAIALSIAGSDPSGGAGIQADLKTFHQFGVYGEAVVTLLTVQNSVTVVRVEVLSAELVREQIEAVVADIPPQAAKTGALGNAMVVRTVGELASRFKFPLVVDPVLLSKHGRRLLSSDAEDALRRHLLPHCALVTPNIFEAEAFSGIEIRTEADLELAARRILAFGPRAVLIKGGHLTAEPVDLLLTAAGLTRFSGRRVKTAHTHGTGCTYSAAITAGLAQGRELVDAITRAKAFIQRAIESAPGLGSGMGPVDHFATS